MVIHTNKLRWLFWLRWKLLMRKSPSASGRIINRIAFIIQLIATLLAGTAVTVTLSIFFRTLTTGANVGILFLLLSGIYAFWLVSPLAGFYTNEGLNLSKLNLYPLSRLELMLSLVISTLLDFSTIWLFFLLLSVIIGWGTSVALILFSLLAMLIFYVQIVSMSQLILALLASLLQTRRLRDLGIILLALFSMSGFLCRFVVPNFAGSDFMGFLTRAPFASYLQWTPPGMAARAVQQAASGHWIASLSWLGGLLVITLGALYLWQRVIERSLTIPEIGGTVKRSPAARSISVPEAASPSLSSQQVRRPLPAQSLAILMKDSKYLRRDPQITTVLVRSLFFIILPMAYVLTNQSLGYWRIIYLPFLVFFSLLGFSHNSLGYERQSLTTLLLFPIHPKQILWGKNALVFIIGLIDMCVGIPIVALLSHNWDLALPVFIIGIAGLGILCGCGNFMSVFFPAPVRFAQRGSQITTPQSSEGGCLRVTKALTSLLVELIIMLPVLGALLVPIYVDKRWIWILTIPCSLLYGAVIYIFITGWVAPRIISQAPELLARLTRN